MSISQHQYSPIEQSYAGALLGAARRLGIVQRALEEARVLVRVLRQNPRLPLFLSSPQISGVDKKTLLDRVFKGRLSPLMMQLVQTMSARRRTLYMIAALELFQELVEQSEGVWRVDVTTARDMGFQEKLRLKAALEKYTKNQLKIEYHQDPRLIGGLICRMRDRQIDASLRTQLDELGRRLKATTLKIA